MTDWKKFKREVYHFINGFFLLSNAQADEAIFIALKFKFYFDQHTLDRCYSCEIIYEMKIKLKLKKEFTLPVQAIYN